MAWKIKGDIELPSLNVRGDHTYNGRFCAVTSKKELEEVVNNYITRCMNKIKKEIRVDLRDTILKIEVSHPYSDIDLDKIEDGGVK